MKNHELLDLIGEAGEDYVLAADSNVIRPRFRWKTWAVCAACAALALGIGLRQRSDRTVRSMVGSTSDAVLGSASMEAAPPYEPTLVEIPGLHSYIEVEGERQIITFTATASENQQDSAAGGDAGQDTAGAGATDAEAGTPAGDFPLQEAADEQYRQLLLWLFGTDMPGGEVQYPEWFGGVWVDNDYWPEARLAVAIVDSLRTSELEEQISSHCGGTQELLLPNVKYSQNELTELIDKISQVFDKLNWHSYLCCGLNVMENRIELNCSDVPSDEVLAALAGLDPDGDAIFIQVFAGGQVRFTDGAAAPLEPSAAGEGAVPLTPGPNAAPGDSTAPEAALSAPPESLPGNP